MNLCQIYESRNYNQSTSKPCTTGSGLAQSLDSCKPLPRKVLDVQDASYQPEPVGTGLPFDR